MLQSKRSLKYILKEFNKTISGYPGKYFVISPM